MDSKSAKIESIYNQFNGKNFEILNQFYAPDVEFIDPVTRIKGLDALKTYYAHAYQFVTAIKFHFSDISHENQKYTAIWQMNLSVKGLNAGQPFTVDGVSILHFDAKGLICYHRDYLDLGAMVYERIPIQGAIIRSIKNRLRG